MSAFIPPGGKTNPQVWFLATRFALFCWVYCQFWALTCWLWFTMRCQEETSVVYFQMCHWMDWIWFLLAVVCSCNMLTCTVVMIIPHKPAEKVGFLPHQCCSEPVSPIIMNVDDCGTGSLVLSSCGGRCRSFSQSPIGHKTSIRYGLPPPL